MEKINFEQLAEEARLKTKIEIAARQIKIIVEKAHEENEKNRKRGYYIKNGRRISYPQSLRQFIPKTEKSPEEKKEELNKIIQKNFIELLGF